MLKRTFEHPAITPEIYADGLTAYEQHMKHLMFRWLLKGADQNDLMTVQGKESYTSRMPKFRAAIDEAFKTAQPGETRIRDIQRVERVEEIFEELGCFRESEEPVDLIGAYLGVDTPTPRRKAKEAANWIKLRTVIDRRELVTAVKLYKGDKLLHHKGIEYVIDQQFPDFIVSFIRHAYETNGYILSTLCRKGSKEIIEKVLEKVNFSQKDLVKEAAHHASQCNIEKLLVLLNKIETPERQEYVVESSIGLLLDRCPTDRFHSFLNALKSKSLLSEHLLERILEDPAITPELYADGLIAYGKYEKHLMVFQWLLKRADRDDLVAVRGKNDYYRMWYRSCYAIDDAWKTAPPGGTRTHAIQRVERVEEIFEELGYFRESEEPVDLISAYIGIDKPTPRRKVKEAANWIRLREVIDRRELETAVVLYKQDRLIHHQGIDYVIEKQFPEFIVSFIRHAYETNGYILSTLCRKGSKEIIESVLEKVDFPQQDLVDEAAHHASRCNIEKLVVLLDKIETPERQESVVRSSIGHVLDNCSTDRLYFFLNALRRKSLLSGRLENGAIQMAFKNGVDLGREDLLKRTFDHPAITPGLYADALTVTERLWEFRKPAREWLLKEADRDDLQEVQGRNDYKDMKPEFRAAIDEALKTAQPGGTRTHIIQRVERVEEIFEEFGPSGVYEDPTKLISAYLGVDTPTPRRNAKEAAANWSKFRAVIDEGELETAVVLYKGDKLLHHKGMDYVLEQQFPEFIVNFVNQTNQANARTLDELCKKCSKEAIENVLEKVDFSQSDLIEVASEGNAVCHLPKFLMLLNKITTPEGQESAVTNGINVLIREKSIEYINPMLDALKDKIFRSERLEAIAIQNAFKEGAKRNREDVLKCTFDHLTITPALYAHALIESEKSWESSKPAREWLLKEADRDDLQAVNDNDGYADLILPFRTAIEKALEIAKPGGTRTRAYDIQSAKVTKKEFMEIGHAVAISGIANIIGEYLAGQEDEEREVQRMLQEQEEEIDWGAELGGGEDEEEEWGSI